MKDLSIIIVNYNVAFFLEQCLRSVFNAQKALNIEVFVVDNNSVDDSTKIVKEKFPQVTLIENKDNVGFSKANNQALKIAAGKYVLLLNPDTVVQEDTFEKSVQFMNEHHDCGGLGVKMIDGKGKFLPESKRGLPTPSVAFYKIFGFSKLFPKSQKFGKYHLSYLPENETHEIDVLAGAFMLMRMKALEKCGFLDEIFFMYGEDIDLSYRITKAGYKNYYYPHTQIIHYKGESTKKGSLNYVLIFYRAMILFTEKHFEGKQTQWFSHLIRLAVYLRMGISILKRLLNAFLWPVVDTVIAFTTYTFFIYHYQTFSQITFPYNLLQWAIPLHILTLILSGLMLGIYHPKKTNQKLKKLWLYGSIITLIGYSFLPEDFRFSRLIVAVFPTLFLLTQLISRQFSDWLFGTSFFKSTQNRKIGIVGDQQEIQRVKETISPTLKNTENIKPIFTNQVEDNVIWNGTSNHLKEMVNVYELNELIFCPKNIEIQTILNLMMEDYGQTMEFKMAPEGSIFVIGSNSINTRGEIYIRDTNPLNKKINLMRKRVFDLLTAIIILSLHPIMLLYNHKSRYALSNVFFVLIGKRTWVGLNPSINQTQDTSPIPEGVFPIAHEKYTGKDILDINFVYQEDYSWEKDFKTLVQRIF